MLCVGFVEEVIFRGFLFKAIARDNETLAIIISSVTFGLGHLLNLVNGSGAELVEDLFQVTGAIVIGFLFVILFDRGGSLLPCIITHAVINNHCCLCFNSYKDAPKKAANRNGEEAKRRAD